MSQSKQCNPSTEQHVFVLSGSNINGLPKSELSCVCGAFKIDQYRRATLFGMPIQLAGWLGPDEIAIISPRKSKV